MIVCVDLDGTLSADPQFYRAELDGLMKHGNQVHILSGNPTAEKVLGELGFVKGRDYTCCAIVPNKHISRVKVAYMQRVGATQLVDNRLKNIVRAQEAGFTGHWHASPQGAEED